MIVCSLQEAFSAQCTAATANLRQQACLLAFSSLAPKTPVRYSAGGMHRVILLLTRKVCCGAPNLQAGGPAVVITGLCILVLDAACQTCFVVL